MSQISRVIGRTGHSLRIAHPFGAGSTSSRWSARLLVSILAANSVALVGCKDPRNSSLTGDASMMDAPVDQAIGHAGASGAGGSSSGGAGVVADAGMDVAPGSGGAAGGAPGSGGVLGSGGSGGAGGAPGGAGGGAHAFGGASGSGGVGTGGQATGGGGSIGSGGMGDTGGGPGPTCTATGSCGTVCKPGTNSCATGTLVCANQANALLGTGCGTTGMVCDGGGSCVSKIANGSTCANDTLCQSGNCSVGTGGNICCQSGYANCGSCVNKQTDANNCGTCGTKCGANKTCSGGACACTGPALMCGTCGSWSFDTAATEGWGPDTNPGFGVMGGGTQNGIQNLTTSSSMKHDGSNALAVVLNVNSVGGTNYASVAVPICSTNVGGYVMSAWVYFLGTTFDSNTFFWFTAWSASAGTNDRLPVGFGSNIPVNQWTHLSVTFDGGVADHVAIQLSPGTDWSGTMYIDSVTLTPP